MQVIRQLEVASIKGIFSLNSGVRPSYSHGAPQIHTSEITIANPSGPDWGWLGWGLGSSLSAGSWLYFTPQASPPLTCHPHLPSTLLPHSQLPLLAPATSAKANFREPGSTGPGFGQDEPAHICALAQAPPQVVQMCFTARLQHTQAGVRDLG